ncbi:MAG: hypothetical protein U9Q80_02900 [Bacillota bacterium]|nr:hypothetical protein [Bacillota bacterium]
MKINLFKKNKVDITIRNLLIVGSIYIILKAFVHYSNIITTVSALSVKLAIKNPTKEMLMFLKNLEFNIEFFVLPILMLIFFKLGIDLMKLVVNILLLNKIDTDKNE